MPITLWMASTGSRVETKYHGGTSSPFLPNTGKRGEDAAPAGVADLLRGAVALLGTDYHALSGDGVGHIRDPATGMGWWIFVILLLVLMGLYMIKFPMMNAKKGVRLS